jgi:hypothetical protein
MFDAQILRCFFDMHGLEYELIGTKKVGERYTFCDIAEMDRRRDLRDKIHILEHPKVNAIGDKRTSLSYSWYSSADDAENRERIERVRKNIGNVFKNIWGVPSKDAMWTTYKEFMGDVATKGYQNSFITYNKRASNEYAHKSHLAYCVNNFPRPWEVKFFRDHNIREVPSDTYALSILIQWVFRSRIRKGEEIWVYIPSARMRSLFAEWVERLAEGRDLEPIHYKQKRKESTKRKHKASNQAKRKDT